jgi:hypothetical protein
MSWLEIDPDGIPSELRCLPWVLWRAEPRGDAKPGKVPYRISDPIVKASSTDSSTWGPFWDAVNAYALLAERHRDPDPALGPLAGIGVVLTHLAGVVCLDLDGVLVNDTLDPPAARIVAHCRSWTERSPSGSGIHVFGHGTLDRAIKGDGVEAYDNARFIAVTGHRWSGTPPELRDLQAYLDRLAALDRPVPSRPWTGPRIPPPDDLAGALLAKLEPWGVSGAGVKRWNDGYLVELPRCPWAAVHTTGGPGGAAVMIRASGAFDFVCLHAHCADRGWRNFRLAMERV